MHDMLDIYELMGKRDEVIVSATQLDVVLDRLHANLRRVSQTFDRMTMLLEKSVSETTAAAAAAAGTPATTHASSTTVTKNNGGNSSRASSTQQQQFDIATAIEKRLLLRSECREGINVVSAIAQDLDTLRAQRQALTANCDQFIFMAINHYMAFLPEAADLAQPLAEDGTLPRIDLVNPALLDEYHDGGHRVNLNDASNSVPRRHAYAEASTNPLHNIQISPY